MGTSHQECTGVLRCRGAKQGNDLGNRKETWQPVVHRRTGNPAMKTLELRKASKPLADYASDLGSDSLVITSNNKPVAVLVSLKDADRESIALGLSPEFGRIIRRARAEAKKGKVFSLKQVRDEISAAPKQSTARAKKPLGHSDCRRICRRKSLRFQQNSTAA